MAEQEFNLCDRDRAGANPIDYSNFSLVGQLGATTDFLLVLVHGGTERLQFPRPGLVELCRFLVDQGANAIIVQHTHCAGCFEFYRDAPIVYGQGNCIFASLAKPGEEEDPNWFTGMFVELVIDSRRGCKLQLHPFEQSRGFAGLKPLVGKPREEFMRGLNERSQLLADPKGLRREWEKVCQDRRTGILARSHGLAGFLASVNHRINIARWMEARTDANLRWHLIACESHRELLADCLRLRPTRRPLRDACQITRIQS